jgi:hypothetical protein
MKNFMNQHYLGICNDGFSFPPSAPPAGSVGGFGDGNGRGCSTGEEADLCGGATTPSAALEDLKIGGPSPTASDAEARPLECGGEEGEVTSMPRSASSLSRSSTWRSFRCRVSWRGWR